LWNLSLKEEGSKEEGVRRRREFKGGGRRGKGKEVKRQLNASF
jgi:hypothetical protein